MMPVERVSPRWIQPSPAARGNFAAERGDPSGAAPLIFSSSPEQTQRVTRTVPGPRNPAAPKAQCVRFLVNGAFVSYADALEGSPEHGSRCECRACDAC